ncbi:MAG: S9 family peptidase, partial [Bacteroidota bacterium]
MKKPLFIVTTMLIIASCNSTDKSKIDYPETKKVDVVDDYYGTSVKDPYRWLEDDNSAETAAWVEAQNEVTFAYLEKIPYRDEIKSKLTEMWNYEKYTPPFKEGEYTYFYKNDGLQDQYVVYRQKEDGEPEVFLDPNKFSEDGTTSLSTLSFSEDGSKSAYAISEGGSDWRKVIMMDALSKEIIGDTIRDVKFSGLSWKENEGFYYSSYDKPEGSELTTKTDHHKLYFHKLGTSQEEDELVFGADRKRRYVGGSVTEDGKYLVITASISTTGNELYIKDLSKPGSELLTIVDNFDNDHYVIYNEGSKLYIVTNLDAPNRRIVTVDASDPGVENWLDFIPETENVLTPSTGAGYFFAHYMIDALSKVLQYDIEGNMDREIELPGIGTASGFSGKR